MATRVADPDPPWIHRLKSHSNPKNSIKLFSEKLLDILPF
jgi:hypothetical protein